MKTNLNYPIDFVRKQFPALNRTHNNKQVAYFDGPGGTQVAGNVIEAISDYMKNGGANLHGPFPSSIETENHIKEAKMAIADLINVNYEEVAFGANSTSLAFSISRAIARDWKAGDEIVVTELDHRCNVDPWITAAKDKGATVRWIKVDVDNLTLDLSNLDSIINENTKLVAVGLASNAVGTINDAEIVSARAKEVGALVVIDAVQAVPHIYVDRDYYQADILLCSAYKFFGPHIGVAAIKKELFEKLEAYKLTCAPEYIPDKLETGTQNHEGIAGIKSAVEFIASLGQGDTRKEKIISGYNVIEEYENFLAEKVRKALSKLSKVKLYQPPNHVRKTPTVALTIDGISVEDTCKWVIENYSIFIAHGHFYASTLAQVLDVDKDGSWTRIGLSPYNTEEEVDNFIEAITLLVK